MQHTSAQRKSVHPMGEVCEMTIIKVRCADCGDIDLKPLDLYLTVKPDGARYEFDCPACHTLTSKPAASEIVNLLTAAGVPTIEIPAEFSESRAASQLEPDEVLDFALAMKDDRLFHVHLSQLHRQTATLKAGPAADMRRTSVRKRRWRIKD